MLDRLLGRRRPPPAEPGAGPSAQRDGAWGRNTELGFERLIFFSDAVFAIAITLLALEIRLPDLPANVSDAQLRQALGELTPKYISFLVSFLAIGAYWVGHHYRFEYINRYDLRLIWINLLALACVAFLPFPTGLVGDHPNSVLAVQIYAGTMAATGFAVYLTWWYAVHNHRLVDPDLPARVIRRQQVRALIAPLVFLVSIGLATVFNADVAEQSWWSLLIIYIVLLRERA